MTTKKLQLNTRPFQCLWHGAADLLLLAKPLHESIEESKRKYEKSGKIDPAPNDVWRREKSLSIASFLMAYAGLEAFINIVYRDFKVREMENLPDSLLPLELLKHKKSIINKPFEQLRLDTRAFLVVPLCAGNLLILPSVFDLESKEWKSFREIQQIRANFHHASSEEIFQTIRRVGQKEWIADDSDPRNFWPMTGAPRDHRIMDYTTAVKLRSVIDWVAERIAIAIPDKVTSSFLSQETMKLLDE